ncbi:hypothetical protein YC2023_102568 [Brassica napus]
MQHRNRASKRKKSTRCSNLKGSWGLHAASGGLWNADAKHGNREREGFYSSDVETLARKILKATIFAKKGKRILAWIGSDLSKGDSGFSFSK